MCLEKHILLKENGEAGARMTQFLLRSTGSMKKITPAIGKELSGE
jgi:hypothetical protein